MLLVILSIVSLIRAFLIIAIVVLIIRWISKLFSPVNSENRHAYSQNHPVEGETTIQTKHQEKKNNSKNKGEYVDFEEIE